MNLDRVTSGRDAPNDVNVIIEIPMHAPPIKYEVDKATGAMFVDRFLSTSMFYPCNYGYIPHTLSGDGDPVDVLVVSPLPIVPGAVVREPAPAKPHVDLRFIVTQKLLALGLTEASIDQIGGCTVLEPEHFFSFRRDGKQSGRHLSAIVPRPRI